MGASYYNNPSPIRKVVVLPSFFDDAFGEEGCEGFVDVLCGEGLELFFGGAFLGVDEVAEECAAGLADGAGEGCLLGVVFAAGVCSHSLRFEVGAVIHHCGIKGAGGGVAVEGVLQQLLNEAADCFVAHCFLFSRAVMEHDGADVCLNDDDWLVVGERQHGTGGVGADAGQGAQCFFGCRHDAVVCGGDGFCGVVQCDRPTVVAEAAPEPKHFFSRGVGERGDVRKCFYKGGVLRHDTVNLCLLQHTL